MMGIRDESGEYVIGTANGFCKVRTIRRKGSEEDRWNWEEFLEIRGLPWEPTPGRPGTEMTSRIGGARSSEEVPERNQGEDREPIKRAFRIEKGDVKRHGVTVGCQGCTKAVSGGTAVNHNKRCRDRFEEKFRDSGDPRLLRQVERMPLDEDQERTIREVDERQVPQRSSEDDEDMSEQDGDEVREGDNKVFSQIGRASCRERV